MAEENTPEEITSTTPPVSGEMLIERLGEQATGTEKTVPEAGKKTIGMEPEVLAEVQLAVMRQSLRLRISSSNCVKKVSKPSLIRSLGP